MKQDDKAFEQLSAEIECLRFYLLRMTNETGSFVDPVVVSISQLLDKKINLWMKYNEMNKQQQLKKSPDDDQTSL
ncbi:MAG TPA: aspartyl-phosphate phosphatase Spo0E family protein [Bacillota bacterium]|nr:aspartyl-phosphate phosphatase Spo0E family protein [Bacillota bacterium]